MSDITEIHDSAHSPWLAAGFKVSDDNRYGKVLDECDGDTDGTELIMFLKKEDPKFEPGKGEDILAGIMGCRHRGLLARVLGPDSLHISAVWANLPENMSILYYQGKNLIING